MTEHILLDRHPDGTAILTFNRPAARNALRLEMMRRFAQIIAELGHDERLRVLILTGAGEDSFCSGGDLQELNGYPTEADGRMMITIMGDALLALERLPVPVIAAVNGYALGGGSEIALACDMRIVDENARLGLMHIRLGLTPGWGAGQRLMRLVGYARALELLMRGHIMRAAELQTLGLANQVVAQGTALSQAINLARTIAEAPPGVIPSIKRLLQAGLHESYETALQIERDQFPPLWAAESHLDAVEKFLNKARKNA